MVGLRHVTLRSDHALATNLARVEITDPSEVPANRAAEFPKLAEAAGLDGVGMPDHQHSGRDVYVHLGMAAANTSHIGLFPCVTNVLTRHPMVLASLANSLEELAPGRVRLVIGAGDQSAKHIGMASSKVNEVRDAVIMVRSLLSGQEIAIGSSRSERLTSLAPRRIPVHINASSPRMIRLAGEVADGVLLMVGRAPGAVDAAQQELRAGADKAGRSLDDFTVCYALPTFIEDTHERARQRAALILRFWLDHPSRIFTRLATNSGLNNASVNESHLIDTMGLVGTAEECADSLQQFVEQAGVTSVVCQLYGASADPQRVLNAFERTILPQVK